MPAPNTAALDVQLKSAIDGLKTSVASLAPKATVIEMQTQLDALEMKIAERHGNGFSSLQSPGSSLTKKLKEDEHIQRLLKDRRGRAVLSFNAEEMTAMGMGRKSIISATVGGTSEGDPLAPVGVATTGVLGIDRITGITAEARQTLKIRDVLFARPTSMAVVDFVKVANALGNASPVPEASLKPENAVSFTSLSEKVRLIATWIPATKQVLDDFGELQSFLQSSLVYYINLEEEIQLLAGDNTGENLHGLLPQAQAFNTGLLHATSGWNFIDVIGTAVQQINAAKEIDPTFVVLNTNDWWTLRLTKDALGRYIMGDPQMQGSPNIFGLIAVSTTSIPQGTFLVGSGNGAAAELRDRMEMQVEISTENQDYFVRNLVAIRAEKRMALVVKRPNSFVTGSLNSSPA